MLWAQLHLCYSKPKQMKVCTKCNVSQELTEFNRDAKGKDGLSNRCKSCLRVYHILNKERIKIKEKEYRENNPNFEIYRKSYFKNYKKDRMKVDPLYYLTETIRTSIHHALQRKNISKPHKTEDILGCNFNEFKIFIESKFEDWMTWDNRGNPKDGILEYNKTWDLDHIIPIHTAKTKEDLIRLNHYTNFQPLCSKYNRLIKRNKL